MCPGTGLPGGVFIQVGTATGKLKGKWRPPEAATSCIERVDLKREVLEVERVEYAQVMLIGPDKGGHCMVFNSDDCADQTGMPLNEPKGVKLLFHK